MPPVAIHFNGGVNLPDTETVFRTLAERVPYGVRRLPDGETGDRAAWIGFQVPKLAVTPGLRIDTSDEPGGDGYGDPTKVRLTPGTDPDLISWPDLGYAATYATSYETFRELRSAGVVPAEVRFQVEYPTPLAVARLFHPADRERILPSYERALLADLDTLLATVPPDDLAVQWDAAVETVTVDTTPDLLDELAGALAGLVDRVPDEVPAGLHLCYGDAGHKHMFEPESLAPQVKLANAVTARASRPVRWFSFTVPQDRGDRAYFEAVSELSTGPETELYFALVPYHPDQQAEGTTDAQARWIDEFLPSGASAWGICTECGMARVDRADVVRLIDLHRTILGSYLSHS